MRTTSLALLALTGVAPILSLSVPRSGFPAPADGKNTQQYLQQPGSTPNPTVVNDLLWGIGWATDPNDKEYPEDEKKKNRIRKEVAKALKLAHIAESLLDPKNPEHAKFKNYFGKSNRTKVYELYRNIRSNDTQTPGGPVPYINNIIFTKTDTDGSCTKNDWDAYNYIGSTAEENAHRSRIVICDQGWDYRDLPHVEYCPKLGTKVEQDPMDSLAATILHEIIHHYWIGNDVKLGRIDDQELLSGETAYGPCPVRQLAIQDPDKAIRNSDNFAWFAQEMWWESVCGRRFEEPGSCPIP